MALANRLSIKIKLTVSHWLIMVAFFVVLGLVTVWGFSLLKKKALDDFLVSEARGIASSVSSYFDGRTQELSGGEEIANPNFQSFIAHFLVMRGNRPLPFKTSLGLWGAKGELWGLSNTAVDLNSSQDSAAKIFDAVFIDEETSLFSVKDKKGGEPSRIIGAPIYHGKIRLGQLRLACITSEMENDFRSFAETTAVFLFLLSLISAGLVLSLTTRVLKPVKAMAATAEQITESSLQLRIPETGGQDEIAVLAKTFNHLLSRLEKSYDFQSQVVGELSHQLKTPLTVLRGRNEELLGQKDLGLEVQTVLEDNLMDIDRMSSLITTLLNIAKLESHTAALKKERLDWEKLVHEVRDELEPLWWEKDLSFHWSHAVPPVENGLWIWADRFFIKQAVSNILVNAFQFTPVGGVIGIHFHESSGEGGAFFHLTVSNPGPPIPEPDLERIFQRFYQSEGVGGDQQSQGRPKMSFGLGLSICKRIIDQHGGGIRAFNPPGGGAAFEITLPCFKENRMGGKS